VFSGNLDHTSILQMMADRFNSNQDYSAAVGARQSHLARLATVLLDQPPSLIRAPAIPAAALSGINAAVGSGSSASGIAAAGAAANAQALNQVALKAVQDHPDLIAERGWDALGTYVSTARPAQ
jgi:phospholipase C